MVPIVWVGGSKNAVRAFPDDARQDAGFQLSKLQRGEAPDDWKPMSTIGPGVREIRIRERSGAFRIIYVVRAADAIYVLHRLSEKSAEDPYERPRSRARTISIGTEVRHEPQDCDSRKEKGSAESW